MYVYIIYVCACARYNSYGELRVVSYRVLSPTLCCTQKKCVIQRRNSKMKRCNTATAWKIVDKRKKNKEKASEKKHLGWNRFPGHHLDFCIACFSEIYRFAYQNWANSLESQFVRHSGHDPFARKPNLPWPAPWKLWLIEEIFHTFVYYCRD